MKIIEGVTSKIIQSESTNIWKDPKNNKPVYNKKSVGNTKTLKHFFSYKDNKVCKQQIFGRSFK